jgi:hypothetical protein
VPRRVRGVVLAGLALGLTGLAAWTAAAVRYCPAHGGCSWSPWLGVPAALIAMVALASAATCLEWALRGRRGRRSAALLAATVALSALWVVGFGVALAVTA